MNETDQKPLLIDQFYTIADNAHHAGRPSEIRLTERYGIGESQVEIEIVVTYDTKTVEI